MGRGSAQRHTRSETLEGQRVAPPRILVPSKHGGGHHLTGFAGYSETCVLNVASMPMRSKTCLMEKSGISNAGFPWTDSSLDWKVLL